MRIEVDGETYDVGEGKLIDILTELGYDIPHLCYHRAVGSLSSCRLCLVEINEGGEWKIQASCSVDVREGLKVRTKSDRILEIRKCIVELLAKYTISDAVRGLASKYGLEVEGERICILCGLCVAVCSLLGIEAIAFKGRSFDKRVSPPFESYAEICKGCLACTNVCPTGAIRFEDGKLMVGKMLISKHEIVRCEICGKEVAAKEFIKEFEIDEVICEECKRKLQAKRFAESMRV